MAFSQATHPTFLDNEYGHHHAEIEEFEASKYLVSNQEFLAFVEAEGYQTAN
ncbi:SUMF1/EgtB/PvdO family nonheme iron enzyme, partial [Staphylococcus aureus]|uniref:SUMF1/EgtB/PvdO family nonheme iron enzyme n=1 Tax=Staphylococcus aureus TaxID=1280 RepID=UPI0034D95523